MELQLPGSLGDITNTKCTEQDDNVVVWSNVKCFHVSCLSNYQGWYEQEVKFQYAPLQAIVLYKLHSNHFYIQVPISALFVRHIFNQNYLVNINYGSRVGFTSVDFRIFVTQKSPWIATFEKNEKNCRQFRSTIQMRVLPGS